MKANSIHNGIDPDPAFAELGEILWTVEDAKDETELVPASYRVFSSVSIITETVFDLLRKEKTDRCPLPNEVLCISHDWFDKLVNCIVRYKGNCYLIAVEY